MGILNRMLRQLFVVLPTHSSSLYALCREYVDRYNGDNNSDIATNGELQFMRQVLTKSQIVFDVGANVGSWTLMALQVNPHLRVHCFEPNRSAFERLSLRNRGTNVICNNFGLGSRAETRSMYVYGDASAINSLYLRHGLEDGWNLAPQPRAETVRLQSLDAYCEEQGVERIDFAKLDVEGHELEVLRGSIRMLTQGRIKIVQVEYGGCNIDARVLLKDIFDFFGPLHYAPHKILAAGLRHIERYDQRLETFQYQNWAFVAREQNPALPELGAVGTSD